MLCLLSSPTPFPSLPISTSNTDTALGAPVCPKSFLGEWAGFYHLALFWVVTVAAAAAADKHQEQQQKHSPWRKVCNYSSISLYVSLTAPCLSASTLLAGCSPFSPVSITALCVKWCTSHRARQPHKHHLSLGWSNCASVRQGGGMVMKVVLQLEKVTQGMFPLSLLLLVPLSAGCKWSGCTLAILPPGLCCWGGCINC